MKYIFILSSIIIAAVGSQDVPDCRNFKTGVFLLSDTAQNLSYRIERNDSLQIETRIGSGDTSRYKVTWRNDCEYELRIVAGGEEIMEFYKDKVLEIRIIETFEDSYKFKGSVKGIDFDYYQTFIRFKE